MQKIEIFFRHLSEHPFRNGSLQSFDRSRCLNRPSEHRSEPVDPGSGGIEEGMGKVSLLTGAELGDSQTGFIGRTDQVLASR